ncbi:MAG TPA: substrate-binding domain-containing protein [Bryobacteraceae bacterium]|jgi:molybdate-binding protein/DNA-binding XRE family transcriptional regulator|nr:substrate-binding domain-containing protein [Bryobacteraceae bacterium]
MSEIATHLAALRRKRGISAIHLAAAAGVSRQTIYAMEAGTFIPNTAVALRLARALDTTVEELFALAEEEPARPLRCSQATLLPGSGAARAGQAVQLCRVDKRLLACPPSPVPWYLPGADAVVAERPGRGGKARVEIFESEADFAGRILVAGCDPGISVLARHAQPAGVELVLAHRNSSQALELLKEGSVHIAGTHLKDETSGESNLPQIGRLFAKNSVAAIAFAVWEEGILAAAGNPKNIRGIEDLARADVAIVNREKGAGSRALLDRHLKRLRIPADRVRGYDRLAPGHLPAAWQVQSGAVDCCLATRAAARAFGLHFIPLASERYDLVIRKEHLELPRVQNLLDTLARSGFRRELEGFGGYDTRVAGRRVL